MTYAQIIVVALITLLTFWRRDIALYIIACPVLVAFGLSWYDKVATPDGFVVSLSLVALGLYSLALGVINLLGKRGD